MYILQNIEFLHPWSLLLLMTIPLLIWLLIKNNKNKVFLPMPSLNGMKDIGSGWKVILYKTIPYLKLFVLTLFILGLARPRLSLKQESVNAEGIDIIMTMDVSTSMLAKDFEPNRLEASKYVAKEFITNRLYDRIGLIIFSGEAFTFSPVTTDHDLLKDLIDQVQAGAIKDGTAIGNGLAASVNRLKDSKAKSKIIILLTDGVNNTGYIDPSIAMDMAKEYDVKVYTIGIGSNGTAQTPYGRQFGKMVFKTARVEIDEKLLAKIAEETGGQYFRAQNNEELVKIYEYIDRLEKTKIEVRVFKRYSEEFRLFLFPGLLLLLLIFLLKKTILRTVI